MSEIKVNKISPRTACGTTTLGDSGDTFTIPSGVTITNSGTANGFGATGAVNWQTGSIKTTGFTAANGEGYFVDTSSGAVTATLPSSPSPGNIVAFADYTRTFGVNALTIGRNSQPIGGVAQDALLEVTGQSATFVYVDGTEGWININETQTSVTGETPFIAATGGTITTSGDYRIHTFTGPGTFAVDSAASNSPGPAFCGPTRNNVSYLVVGGGGGGGSADGGGGAGAGGFREFRAPLSGCYSVSPLNGNPGGISITVAAGNFPIVIGGGGAGGSPGEGTAGNPSSFSTVTSAGGGYGGGFRTVGGPGGSGGGGGGRCNTAGGSGNTPPVSPPQGNAGGNSAPSSNPSTIDAGGSGGGAGAAGSNASNNSGVAGAVGVPTSITGSALSYAGGGGGNAESGSYGPGSPCGTGGAGGSGPAPNTGVAGTTNRGGGGGGGGTGTGGTGGSGVVVIRYKFQ